VRLVAALVIAAALAPSGAGSAARTADEGLRALAEAAGQDAPIVRIGLDSAHSVRLSSERPFRIVDPRTNAPVWKDRFGGEIAAVAEGGPERAVPSIYRVQVGAFSTEEAAEAERARLETEFGAPGVVAFVPDRGSFRVRLGASPDREALGPLVDRLRAAGRTGVWITEEPATGGPQVRLRLVDTSYDSASVAVDRVAVVPAEGARIEVEGKAYRGIVELRLSRFGTVRAVGWVGLEAYLRGVVPAELGPEIWPQLEALKAQAVAARTYAWRNLGQFDEDGYDLCATPRCQVYAGASAEHPLSDRAVASTRSEILVWEGRPISALYTATCGGHTENAAEIFPEERAPYLVGVPCRAEGEALAASRVVLNGRAVPAVASETGEDVTRDWALLVAAGIAGERADPGAAFTPDDLLSWSGALARIAGRPATPASRADTATLGRAAAALVESVGWGERARVLLDDSDLPALLRDAEASALPADERRALAYLVSQGALGALPDGTLGVARAPTRARMAAALARVGDAYGAFDLREAILASAGDGRLRLVQGRGDLTLPLDEAAFLFASVGGRAAAVPRLELWPGDRLRFRTGRHGRIDFLELRPPVKGVADDRSAKVFSWEVRQTRAEVEEAVNRRLSVGRLRGLEVVRRGVSGRILELRVVGDRGSSVVKGFDVRTLLGLRESLTVIELQKDPAGEIEAVVFAGKGWGHGVGLCQVGAYGMAVRGSSYREILGHYYRGARLERIPRTGR